ncbi:MAG: hypothetical protein WBG95_05150 [Sulfitobacter sp.]
MNVPLRAVRVSAAEANRRIAAHDIVTTARAEAAGLIEQAKIEIAAMNAAAIEANRTLEERTIAQAESTLEKFVTAKQHELEPDIARLALEQIATLQHDYASMQNWIVDLVIEAVEKVVGDIDRDTLLEQLIVTGIKDFGTRWQFSLHVSPAEYDICRELVANATPRLDAVQRVVPQTGLEEGTLLLRAPGETRDVGFSVQLDALRKILNEGVESI